LVLKKYQKSPKHLAWNISKSWWRPFLSHIIVFFVLNLCTILYFTIIIRENSLYMTGCIGVEEIPKKCPKHLAWNISKSWWRPFLSHVIVFFVLNQCTILYFTIIIRENSLHVTGCIGIEEIQKKFPKSSSLKYFQIVVETSPITCNCIFHVESVYNTLFYNNYKRKLIICDWLHWCWRNTKKMSQTSSLKYFQIVVETFPITYNGIFGVESV
jgi:hypothetical protein